MYTHLLYVCVCGCVQISYNYMLPFENIPDDLVPLTAHFKQLLTYASPNQPLTLYLDSVDQLTGTQDSNKVSWIPTRLPAHCKVSASSTETGLNLSCMYYSTLQSIILYIFNSCSISNASPVCIYNLPLDRTKENPYLTFCMTIRFTF